MDPSQQQGAYQGYGFDSPAGQPYPDSQVSFVQPGTYNTGGAGSSTNPNLMNLMRLLPKILAEVA